MKYSDCTTAIKLFFETITFKNDTFLLAWHGTLTQDIFITRI